MIPVINYFGTIAEKTPLLRDIAGSLYIYAVKPA
jgi:hypothetical protein